METMGASFDAEWESICKLFSVEESDSCAHLLDYSPPASVQDDNLTSVAPSSSSYLSNRSFFGNFSEENYLNGNVSADNCLFGVPCYNDLPVLNDVSLGMLFAEDARNEAASTDEGSSTPQKDNAFHDIHSARQSCCTAELSLKRKLDDPVTQDQVEEKTSSMGTPKKKARISKTAQKVKKKGQPKKDEVTPTVNGGEEAADVANDNSEDESNVSEETNEVSESTQTTGLTSTGKKRASRGAATDPQSLYARRRRMRINERLRILQNLVPNGTKVDISTMLEEAFHYVKFLQLQIRLLSSDDLWMFAPLAYNGFDVGGYRKMSPFLGI